MQNRTRLLSLLLALTCLGAPCFAQPRNMIGRQSQNEGLLVLPAPGKVTIDGDLRDWDFSGRIWVFADKDVRQRYSVEVAAMWDDSALYLAAKWKDPTPMYNTIDPEFNPEDGWKSDSWQMRVRTDRTCWITTWYFTPKQMPVMHVAYWKSEADERAGQEVKVYRAQPGGTDLGGGVEMAYRKDADGQGFVQEIRIPWSVLYRQVPKLAPGLSFRMGHEFLWGDPTGRTWPIHRYADNMQPGVTSREFFWTEREAWGDMKLAAAGRVEPRRYVDDAQRLAGTVPIRLSLPRSAARFTVALNDSTGRRVRNLGGDLAPEDYQLAEEGDTRLVEVKWDCLDDWGRLVEPGTYRAVGLTHAGLGAEYEMCFYNPGTPPWATRDGSGAWGADHAAPQCVARAGEWMMVSWAFAEGGSGIIGIGPDGLKKWGEKRGASALAADDHYVYAITSSWHTQGRLCRLAKADGSYQPFVLDGKARPLELSLEDLGIAEGAPVGGESAGGTAALAACAGKLLLATPGGKLAVLEAASARLLKLHHVPGISALAVGAGPEGRCYAVQDGKVVSVDLETGRVSAFATPGLAQPAALAVDNDGNVVVADVGPDSQVKAYDTAGKCVYTCGRKGGRPIRGPFDPQGMVRMSSVAMDARGAVWVVENWNFPRRVGVWGRDGKLVRDYLGNTGYGGTGCYLHDQRPALAYCGPIEILLDKAAAAWRVSQVLWVPQALPVGGSAGAVQTGVECFPIDTGSAMHPQRFTSSASGQPREYLYAHDPRDGGGHVIYMERGGKWQPVSAVCLAGHISGGFDQDGRIIAQPSGEFAGLNALDGVFWNDKNADGRVQRDECTIVPTQDPGDPPRQPQARRGTTALSLDNGWGGRIGQDLVFYTDGLWRFRPTGFTDDGAPLYAPAGMERFGPEERGDLVPVPEDNLLLCLSFKNYAERTTGMLGIDARTGAVRWSYPNIFPGVHGSHRATMPAPGLLIGPLKICGVADLGGQVGRVFLMRGNLGQDFLMTTDGLYVGAMFQDGRLPGESLPDKEASLRGKPMETFSHGSEPFNGWFGRQADGKVRMTTGFPREAAMVLEVKGLDTLRRLAGPEVTLDREAILKADAANGARALAAAKPKAYTITRLRAAPDARKDPDWWRKLPVMPIERPGLTEKAEARLACDGTNLYAVFDVTDATPWINEGKDLTRLFKTGDAADIQLATSGGGTAAKRSEVAAGDVRIVFAPLEGKPAAVLMRPIDPVAPKDRRVTYHSPVGDKTFDRVEVLSAAQVTVTVQTGRYHLEAVVPLNALGMAGLAAGQTIRGDVGVIFSDAQGRTDAARIYWSNPNTNLVSDLPLEAWLYPATWGELTFE
jgi:hypothetical protein